MDNVKEKAQSHTALNQSYSRHPLKTFRDELSKLFKRFITAEHFLCSFERLSNADWSVKHALLLCFTL